MCNFLGNLIETCMMELLKRLDLKAVRENDMIGQKKIML